MFGFGEALAFDKKVHVINNRGMALGYALEYYGGKSSAAYAVTSEGLTKTAEEFYKFMVTE